jgi:amidophosphoribosyltransferase
MGHEQAASVGDRTSLFALDKPGEECGLVAIYGPDNPVGAILFNGLKSIQNRGRAGLRIHKGFGNVDQAIAAEIAPQSHNNYTSPVDFEEQAMVGIGHVRWSTDISESYEALHPHHGQQSEIAVAHNGHILNMREVAARYGIVGGEHDTDSSLFTATLDLVTKWEDGNIQHALQELTIQLEGAFCFVIIQGEELIYVRDPRGYRPLSLAELPDNRGFMVASEGAAFAAADATFLRDVEPGEIGTINQSGLHSEMIYRIEPRQHCMYEYIYNARPDSRINGASVYQSRKNMGKYLAIDASVEADVVIGVPDSGLPSAAGYAKESGLELAFGIIKNPEVGRSFQQRGERQAQTLREKFLYIREELAGKRIVLIDDSVIKGRTMQALISELREAGVAEIHVRSAAPVFTDACYMGMDAGNIDELIARGRTNDQIAAIIGADSFTCNSIARVEQSIDEAISQPGAPRLIGALCTSCATGRYPFDVSKLQQDVALPIPRLRSSVAIS